MKTLVVLSNDLRISDNKTLVEAIRKSDKLAIVYFVEKTYKTTSNSFQLSLIMDAISQINRTIDVSVIMGRFEEELERLLDKYGFETIYMSYPLSWTWDRRAHEAMTICERMSRRLVLVRDNTLVDLRKIDKAHNFTVFYKKWIHNIDDVVLSIPSNPKIMSVDEPKLEEIAKKLGVPIGHDKWRVNKALDRLRTYDFSRYSAAKDYPGLDATSKLSPFISIGAISIREIYRLAMSSSNDYVRQLAWREYYYFLREKYPFMNTKELKPSMRNIEWKYDKELISAFMDGKTGYPIIDAGIKQLKKDNWMHNRVRLIVASFLTKDLMIDWRIGANLFKELLIDYDEVLNTGNWQWASSVGVDPLPLRVFNPIQQSRRFDPDCTYIKSYLPELSDYECEHLHDPLTHKLRGYHEPIVNHYQAVMEYKRRVFG